MFAVSESTVIGFYLIYASVAVGLVIFLARTLQRHGQVFLEASFDELPIANAVNQLLVIGFYLLNLGYALLVYRLSESYSSLTMAFNELVVRLGILLFSLGVIHLANMWIFWRIGRGRLPGARRTVRSRPLPPAFTPPAPASTPPPPIPGAAAPTGSIVAPVMPVAGSTEY